MALHACPMPALVALGPLLCLHHAADPHLLSGWRRARRLVAQVQLDSDGPCEALRFYDESGQCCWRLHLLPDSDFHAWELLLSRLPVLPEVRHGAALGPLAVRGLRARWRASALRLHAVAGSGIAAPARLAATDVELSPLGQACARRIARESGAFAAPGPGTPAWDAASPH
ncbi:MAG: Hemin transport protein [Arenimonas sp.]|nr:Hemin transport protein [Arenimonas sp.]